MTGGAYLWVDRDWRSVAVRVERTALIIVEHDTDTLRRLPLSSVTAVDEIGDSVDGVHTIEIANTSGYGTVLLALSHQTLQALLGRLTTARHDGPSGERGASGYLPTDPLPLSAERPPNPALTVALLSGLVFVAAIVGAVVFWNWRAERASSDQRVSDLSCALMDQPSWSCSSTAPSLVPLWLLIGAAVVALIIGTAAGVAAYLRK